MAATKKPKAKPTAVKVTPKLAKWTLAMPGKHKGKIPRAVIRAAVLKVVAERKARLAAQGIVQKPWRAEDADDDGEVRQ